MWWIVGSVLILIAAIMFMLCIGAGKADRKLRYMNVSEISLHNKDNN